MSQNIRNKHENDENTCANHNHDNSQEHIYEEIPSNLQYDSLRLNDSHNNFKEDEEHIYVDIDQLLNENNLCLRTLNKSNAHFELPFPIDLFNNYDDQFLFGHSEVLTDIEKRCTKENLNRLRKVLKEPVKFTNEMFFNCFKIRFYRNFIRKQSHNATKFFIELKKIIIESLLLLSDSQNRPFEKLDLDFETSKHLFNNLLSIYNILIKNNNLHKYYDKGEFSGSLERLDVSRALSAIENILIPNEFIENNDKTIIGIERLLSRNTKKYKNILKGFNFFDKVEVCVDNEKRIYSARYYILACLFKTN